MWISPIPGNSVKGVKYAHNNKGRVWVEIKIQPLWGKKKKKKSFSEFLPFQVILDLLGIRKLILSTMKNCNPKTVSFTIYIQTSLKDFTFPPDCYSQELDFLKTEPGYSNERSLLFPAQLFQVKSADYKPKEQFQVPMERTSFRIETLRTLKERLRIGKEGIS